MCVGRLPSFFCPAGKQQAAQTPVVILASRLELGNAQWEMPIACAFAPSSRCSWIKAMGDGNTDFPCGTLPSSSLWCFRRSAPIKTWQPGVPTWGWERMDVPEVQTHNWCLRDWVSAAPWVCWMALGRIFVKVLCAAIYSITRQTCCWAPQFHTDADEQIQCKMAARGKEHKHRKQHPNSWVMWIPEWYQPFKIDTFVSFFWTHPQEKKIKNLAGISAFSKTLLVWNIFTRFIRATSLLSLPPLSLLSPTLPTSLAFHIALPFSCILFPWLWLSLLKSLECVPGADFWAVNSSASGRWPVSSFRLDWEISK